MNRICVYTVITGNYDTLRDIKKTENGIDYICYTNNKKIKSKFWNVKYIGDDKLSDLELSRKIKMLGTEELKKYDVTIYIDGNFTITKSVKKFIKDNVDLEKYDLVGFKHSARDSINEECCACIYYNKENLSNVKKLLDFYKQEKFDDNFGLIEASILFRNFNNVTLNKCMKLWFEMYLKYSHRDQLTLPYVAWKNNLKVNFIKLSVWNNDFFLSEPHNISAKVSTTIFTFNKNKIYDIKEDECVVTDPYLKLTLKNVFKGMRFVVQIASDKNMIFDLNGGVKRDYIIMYQQCVLVKNKIYSGNKVAITILAKKDMSLLEVNLPIHFTNDIYKMLDEVNNEFVNSKNIINYNEYLISEKDKALEKCKEENKVLTDRVTELEKQISKIVNSRGWKALEKVRHTLKRK